MKRPVNNEEFPGLHFTATTRAIKDHFLKDFLSASALRRNGDGEAVDKGRPENRKHRNETRVCVSFFHFLFFNYCLLLFLLEGEYLQRKKDKSSLIQILIMFLH